MNKKPKISIITSVYNGEAYLEQTILSILDQSYDNIEYIIVDGNSKDRSPEIIKKYQEKLKFWVSEPDTGIYNAWNKALEHVTGDWVVFIGADDYFIDDQIISKVIQDLIHAHSSGIRYVYGKICHISLNGELVEVSGKPWETQKKRFIYNMNLPHSGCFHHRSLFDEYGNFDDSFKIAGDYEFLLRELKKEEKSALFIEKKIINMREGGISASLSNRLTLIKEVQKARRNNKIYSFSRELMIWKTRVLAIKLLSSIFGSKFAANAADYYRNMLGKEKRWSN